MDIDMGIDMDIDDFSVAPIDEELLDFTQPQNDTTIMPIAASLPQDPELAAPVLEKVHLRGLDNLKSDDLKAYIKQNTNETFQRLEWIDDTSANIVYATAEEAMNSLKSLLASEQSLSSSPTATLLPAKAIAGFPDSQLMVRLAVAGDKKQPGAREKSRFYLMNPEFDRRDERSARDERNAPGRRRYRDREGDYRRNYDDRPSRRTRATPEFDASLYDDDEASLAKRASVERDSPPHRNVRRQPARQAGYRKELFPRKEDRNSGRLRSRSASPLRDDGGDTAMGDLLADNRAKRNREANSAANKRKAQVIKDTLKKSTAPHLELFPEKAVGDRHKSAFDDAADIFAEKLRTTAMDSGSDTRGKGSLESRITRVGDNQGIRIRGLASQPQKREFNIKGLAAAKSSEPKELFPTKTGMNAGKELFSNKADGRGGRRQRGGDLFL